MVIYIDVLILTNFAVNLCFLLLTKKITHSYASNLRVIIAAIIGSLSSLVILADNNAFFGTLIKVFFLAVQTSVCFKTLKFLRIIKLGGIYFLINLAYAGLALLFWNLFNRKIFYVKNLTVYFDIDTGMLIAVTVVFYIIVTVWEMIKNRCFDVNKSYKFITKVGSVDIEIDAVCDTGNNLTDCYYGRSVVIVSSSRIYNELNLDDEDSLIDLTLHILPYSTVSGNGLLYVTKPVYAEIKNEKDSKNAEVCVGICRNENCEKERCIFNPKILL